MANKNSLWNPTSQKAESLTDRQEKTIIFLHDER